MRFLLFSLVLLILTACAPKAPPPVAIQMPEWAKLNITKVS